MPSVIQFNQAKFQQALLKIAYKKAALDSLNNNNLGFDIRGRAVYDLRLDVEDLKEIWTFIVNKEAPVDADFRYFFEELISLTAIHFTYPIRCNLDLDPEVEDADIRKNINVLNSNRQNFRIPKHRQRMSIIPLYEELLANTEHNNAAVRKRLEVIYSKPLPLKIDTSLTAAYTQAKNSIQTDVNEIASQLESVLSVKEINQKLDKARVTIHEKLKTRWFTAFKFHIDNLDLDLAEKKRIYSALSDDLFKEIYKETPAHKYDILGTDFVNETVSYISNSGERTAHNKYRWAKANKPGASALRFMIRNSLSKHAEVFARPEGQITARLPSVASVEEGDKLWHVQSDLERIVQVFKQLHTDFAAFTDSKEEAEKPIVYNLLTSLDTKLEEKRDKKNFQNESARRILAASHLYNQELSNDQYLWVQNLSVNRHSNSLNGFFLSSLEKEVKLMADIAMLYTLQNNLGYLSLQSNYKQVLTHYRTYLNTSPRSTNFHESVQGKQAAKIIKDCKKYLSFDEDIRPRDRMERTNLALLKMYKHNYHYDEKYGNIIQSLCIFVEKKSVAGCKSANERHEDVQKRVGLLIAWESVEDLTEVDEELMSFLKKSRAKPDNLDRILARAVNDRRMNGDENSISQSDQAGPSKLQIIAKAFARGLWNLGKTVLGLGAVSSIGIGLSILVLTALGIVFPPINIALAISIGVLGIGVASAFVPKLWNFALGCISLGTVSSSGIGIGMAVMAAFGFACPPLGVALSIAVGTIGLGIIASTTGAFVFKAKNTNHACSPEMFNNVNAHADELQSSHGAKIVMIAAEKELHNLDSKPNPRSLLKLRPRQGQQVKKEVRFNPNLSYAPSPVTRSRSSKRKERPEHKGVELNTMNDR